MSGGNANTTISHPGDDWKMLWGNGSFGNFQLDIVGFLAVLGEGAVLANAQVSALSPLFYLPRLIPAPQALLYTSRPSTLPPTEGVVTGVKSGNIKKHVHHVAHILLGDEMPPFTVRCVRVSKVPDRRRKGRFGSWIRGQQQEEIARANTTTAPGPPLISTKINGPLSWVTALGCFLCLCLFTVSIIFGDGMSLVATLLLSSLSTLIGLVNKWTLKLPQRPKNSTLLTTDSTESVVIRYPNGSYLVVKTDEDVARELYFAPEEIDYSIKSPLIYRMLSLVGTLLLMLGVIALANAKLQLQFAWAGAYIIINAAHWLAAAVPAKMHWDLSCYKVEEEGIEGGPANKNFTEALFKAILVTENIRWVPIGDAAPQTEVWNIWLHEAHSISRNLGSHSSGKLMDPLWPKETPGRPVKGTVWAAPSNWNPKDAWNKIDEGHQPDSPVAGAQVAITAPARAHTTPAGTALFNVRDK